MNATTNVTRAKRLALLSLFAAVAAVSTASAAVVGGLPPGHLCGSVSGAAWKYQGQTGTQYNVSGLPAGSCGAALKAVARRRGRSLTQVRSLRTLTGPTVSRLGTGILSPASAGFCGGSNGAKFFRAPRPKNGN
jgi:hypothetical protein